MMAKNPLTSFFKRTAMGQIPSGKARRILPVPTATEILQRQQALQQTAQQSLMQRALAQQALSQKVGLDESYLYGGHMPPKRLSASTLGNKPEMIDMQIGRDEASMSYMARATMADGTVISAKFGHAELDQADRERLMYGNTEEFLRHKMSERVDAYYHRPVITQAQYDEGMRMAERRLKSVQESFNALFDIPAEHVSAPDVTISHPGQVRVRVHVKAFTVETTVGALAAARNDPVKALDWMARFSHRTVDYTRAVDTAIAETASAVVTRILDSENEMETIEPALTQNGEPTDA